MTHETFNRLLERRLELTRNVLASKSKEYATDGDKLHNFKLSAKLLSLGEEPHSYGDALTGMLVKHWTSIMDLVDKNNNLEHGTHLPTALIDEKLGDAINYLCLLEAILKE